MAATILVTGASGFLARHLVDSLSLRHRVYACSRHDLNLLDSLAVEEFLNRHSEIEFVIHCATTGGRRTTNYDDSRTDVVEQNLRMFSNLLRCLRDDQKMIHFGSGAEYDRNRMPPKVTETFFDQYVPADSYGFSKTIISKIILKTNNVVCLRVFGAYGKDEDYRYKFISNAIIKAMLGLPITIAQNVVFDYLYIADFVRLVEKLLDCDWLYRHMNITPTQSVDLASLAEIINEVTGNKAGITVLHPGWNTEYTGDNQRLMEVVGPFDFTPYHEGIRELVAYYQSVWDSLDLDVVRADPFLDKCIVKR